MNKIRQGDIASFFGLDASRISQLKAGHPLPRKHATRIAREWPVALERLLVNGPAAYQELTACYCRQVAAWAGISFEIFSRLAAGNATGRRAGWWERVANRTGVPLIRLLGEPGAAASALSAAFIRFREEGAAAGEQP